MRRLVAKVPQALDHVVKPCLSLSHRQRRLTLSFLDTHLFTASLYAEAFLGQVHGQKTACGNWFFPSPMWLSRH